MKKAYLLTFSDGFGSREKIKKCLNTMSSVTNWRYDMTNAFYLISEEDAHVISNDLRELMNSEGRFIIVELTENKQGWLTKDSWYFMRHKKHSTKK